MHFLRRMCSARGKKCRKRERTAEENCNLNKATKKMAQKERWPLPHTPISLFYNFFFFFLSTHIVFLLYFSLPRWTKNFSPNAIVFIVCVGGVNAFLMLFFWMGGLGWLVAFCFLHFAFHFILFFFATGTRQVKALSWCQLCIVCLPQCPVFLFVFIFLTFQFTEARAFVVNPLRLACYRCWAKLKQLLQLLSVNKTNVPESRNRPCLSPKTIITRALFMHTFI